MPFPGTPSFGSKPPTGFHSFGWLAVPRRLRKRHVAQADRTGSGPVVPGPQATVPLSAARTAAPASSIGDHRADFRAQGDDAHRVSHAGFHHAYSVSAAHAQNRPRTDCPRAAEKADRTRSSSRRRLSAPAPPDRPLPKTHPAPLVPPPVTQAPRRHVPAASKIEAAPKLAAVVPPPAQPLRPARLKKPPSPRPWFLHRRPPRSSR